MSNSAFTPTVLTIPATGGGGTGQGELSLIDNGSAVTDTTGWTGVTRVTSNSPLNPTVPTAFSISNAATAESFTSGGYDSFTLPSGLQNRKLKVEFYYTTPATDVYRVSVYRGSTRVALSTDSSNVTTLPPNTTGKFVAYFDTDNSASWSLNVTRTSGTTGPAYITNVIVGPGIQPQGAVVGATQSVTFTGSWTSNTTYLARETRDGQWANYEVTALLSGAPNSAALTLTLPTGRTIDTTALTSSGGDQLVLGVGTARDEGIASYDVRVMYASTTTVSIAVENASSTYAQINAVTQAAPFTFGSADRVVVTFRVPIAEWAGSGTLTVAQNDVEYAYNTDTSTTLGDNSKFGYGPGGAKIQAITANLTRRVRFQTPIQATDKLVIEVSSDTAGSTWMPLEFGGLTDNTTFRISPYQRQNATQYGIGNIVRVSSTDIDISFGQYACEASSGGFAAAGEAWGTNGGNRYWRVRKQSAGAAVGFGIVSPGTSAGLVSAAGLPGNTTGNAIASGYVGQKITGTARTLSTALGAYVTGATSCITLDKGIYLMFVKGLWTGNNTASIVAFGVSSTASTRTPVDSIFGEGAGSSYNGALCTTAVTTTADNTTYLAPPFYLNVLADGTQYYPTVYSEDQASLSVTINMAAVRIA